jgi:hypothetical protein
VIVSETTSVAVDTGVTAFFHGHDHQYAYEVYDGIVYQVLPSPSMMGPGFNLYSENDPNTKKVLPNAGHLRVTVDPARVTVDYVLAADGVCCKLEIPAKWLRKGTSQRDAPNGAGEQLHASS